MRGETGSPEVHCPRAKEGRTEVVHRQHGRAQESDHSGLPHGCQQTRALESESEHDVHVHMHTYAYMGMAPKRDVHIAF